MPRQGHAGGQAWGPSPGALRGQQHLHRAEGPQCHFASCQAGAELLGTLGSSFLLRAALPKDALFF